MMYPMPMSRPNLWHLHLACPACTGQVYMAASWANQLPPKGEVEQVMLEALGDLVELRPTSRLACQVPLTDALSGIEVIIAPEA